MTDKHVCRYSFKWWAYSNPISSPVYHLSSSICVESVLHQSQRPQIICAFTRNLRKFPERSTGVQTMRVRAMIQFGKRSHQPLPKAAVANGYVIGDPPMELSSLNDVELSLISRARIYCQSWIFFGGCHQHIKGWHTFFKN